MNKRWEKVHEEEKLHGYIPIHPYEEPRVMAGQGTIGLEILEDLPDVQTVVVPIAVADLCPVFLRQLKRQTLI